MAVLNQRSSPRNSGSVWPSVLVSREFRWTYLMLLAALALIGSGFLIVGVTYIVVAGFYSNSFTTGLVYSSIGILVLVGMGGLRQLRRYLSHVRDSAADSIASAELQKLSEGDFESFERIRRLREEKAQRDFERNLNATFVVQRFEARDITLFPEVAWELQPGLNVLLGRNGYGKSLILRALAGALQRDEEATALLFPDSLASDDSVVDVRLTHNDQNARILRTPLRFAESVGKIPILAIPDARFFDRSVHAIGPADNESSDLIANGAREFLHQKSYASIVQGLLYEICLDYWEHGRSFKRPVFQFLEECVKRLTNYEFRFHSIERSGRTAFEIRVITEGNSNPLPLQSASQGTLSLLAMCGLIRSYLRLVTAKPDDGPVHSGSAIVIIDEADAHLHPTWQQKFPTLLRDFFPNVQFILSAHSPLFVAGCWKGEVAVLRRQDATKPGSGFSIERVEEDFIGASSADIYRRIFQIEELDDNFLEYAKKATLRETNSSRINELTKREEGRALSIPEHKELSRLLEESRRIRAALDVASRRREESEKGLAIAELEAEVLKLQTQLGARQTQV